MGGGRAGRRGSVKHWMWGGGEVLGGRRDRLLLLLFDGGKSANDDGMVRVERRRRDTDTILERGISVYYCQTTEADEGVSEGVHDRIRVEDKVFVSLCAQRAHRISAVPTVWSW